MKKVSIILIIISILLVLTSLIIMFTSDKNDKDNSNNNLVPNNNENKDKDQKEDKTDNIVPYEKEELYNIVSEWAIELYGNNNYDKCVMKDDICFLSLESLEKDYNKDISKFKDERGECLLDISGINFNMNDDKTPFSLVLEGCKFLDITDKLEQSKRDS